MMYDEHLRQVRTGGDPRSLPEFMALRDEMSKLTHPARPDVDWAQVEKLSLSLFEINGVELQTCAWYTRVDITSFRAMLKVAHTRLLKLRAE